MNKIITTLVIAFFSNTFFAQSTFDKFDGREEVTSIIVNKKMFDLMGNVKVDASDKEAQNYLNLIRKLDNLKVFTTTNVRISAEMKSATEIYSKTSGLVELMRVNDNGQNISILVKSGSTEDKIKELLMFIEGGKTDNKTVLMLLNGNFSLNEIPILTDKMRIPGGDILKKTTKNKQ
jgi:hypothetical protein